MNELLKTFSNSTLREILSNKELLALDPFKRSVHLQKLNIEKSIIPPLSALLDLQKPAQIKLGIDQPILLDRLALEQSSAKWVSDYKNQIIPTESKIIDLCCGLGGDSLHLNNYQSLTGIDLLESRLAMFNFNLEHKDRVYSIRADATMPILKSSSDFLLCDPDRRSQTNRDRNWDPADLCPNFDELAQWQKYFSGALFKLSPSLDWKSLAIKGDIDFLGEAKDCREALIRRGSLAAAEPTLRAVIKGISPLEAPWAEVIHSKPQISNQPLAYLIEPAKVCVRSGLNRWYAQKYQHKLLHPDIAYLTSETPIENPYFTNYKVIDWGTGNDKKVKALVQKHKIRVVEVKKRGSNIEPAEELAKLKKLKGDKEGTLFFTQGNEGHLFILTQRIV